MSLRSGCAEIERRLESLGYDGIEANFRSIMSLRAVPEASYRKVLEELEKLIERRQDSARLHALKGKLLSNLAEYEPAIEALRRSLALERDQALVRAWLGGVHLLKGRLSHAVAELDRAVRLDSRCAWAYFYRAAGRFALGRRQACRDDLNEALGLGGEAALAARAFFGLLEAKEDRFDSALKALDRVVKARGGMGWARGLQADLWLRRANLEAGRERYGGAISDLGRALKLAPASRDARGFGLRLAQSLGEKGRQVEAKSVLMELAKRLRGDGELLFILAQQEERMGQGKASITRLQEARTALSRELLRDGGSDEKRLALAKVLFQLKRFKEAERAAGRALKANPGWEPAESLLAEILVQDGRCLHAERLLRQALSRRPDSTACAAALANVLIKQEKFAEAAALLRKTIERGPAAPGLLGMLANILMRQENFAEAEGILREALGKAPRSAEFQRLLTEVLIRQKKFAQAHARRGGAPPSADSEGALLRGLIDQGNLKEALSFLRAASARGSRLREFQESLARTLHRAGRIDECIDLLSEFDREGRGLRRIRLELSQTLIGEIRFDEAESLLKPLGSATSGDFEASRLWGLLFTRQGRLTEAAAAYEKACAAKPGHAQTAIALAETLLRLGEIDRMFQVLEKARRQADVPGQTDVSSALGRFRLALCSADFEGAGRAGEAVLDQTRRFEDLDPLCRPSLFDRDEFEVTPEVQAYRDKLTSSLARYIASHRESPWGYYFRGVLHEKYPVAAEEELGEASARLRALPIERYGWMRYQVGIHCLGVEDFAGAQREFAIAAKSSRPGDWRSQCHLAEALLCQGDLNAALEACGAAEKMAAGRLGEVLAWRAELLLWAGEYRQALRVLDAIAPGSHAPLTFCWKGGALVKLGRCAEALPHLDRAIRNFSEDREARIWRCEALYGLKRFTEALKEGTSPVMMRDDVNFYRHVIRGLTLDALGDREGMRREFEDVPPAVVEYVEQRASLGRGRSSAEIRETLAEILRMSRGVRRGAYEPRVWMKSPLRAKSEARRP